MRQNRDEQISPEDVCEGEKNELSKGLRRPISKENKSQSVLHTKRNDTKMPIEITFPFR